MKETIIITGAGSGIGAESARKLSKKGYQIVLLGRNTDKLQDVMRSLENPGDHLAFSCDISSQESVRAAYSEAHLADKNVVALFANAGIGGENTYSESDRWSEILSTNLDGTYFTIMEALPLLEMSQRKVTNVVITSSCLARFGVPNYTAYCTSKAGLLGLTRSLAVELASKNILVNAICPGWVDTKMARDGIQLLADRMDQPYDTTFSQQMDMVPTGRMSNPGEIANLVDYLVNPEQKSITGQALDINNGSFMI